eukprot:11732244-Ditylum_brightwellii.AAC.1
MEKSEKRCKKMCEENMINSKKQVCVTKKWNKCLDKQGSLPDELEKRMVKDITITLLMMPFLAAAVRKRKYKNLSIMEKCGNRNSMKFNCMDTQKHTDLFTAKIGVWNTQSPQGSVGIHHSA